MSKKNIKDKEFEILPDEDSMWLVLAWGKVVNEFNGSYKQQLVLKKIRKEKPDKEFDLIDSLSDDIKYVTVDLGSLRVLSPGTIIQNKKIKYFVEEYLEKITVKIPDPQSLQKNKLRAVCIQDTIEELAEFERINARSFYFSDENIEFIFPSSAICDYYFFGMTSLIKAVFEGFKDLKKKVKNTIYYPKKTGLIPLNSDKRIAYIELKESMFNDDKIKIARLAFDNFFKEKSLDVHKSIIELGANRGYIDVDFPINESIELKVYGIKIENKFLVFSISFCSSKLPFDLLIAHKRFKGKGNSSNSNPNSEDDNNNLPIEDFRKPPKKPTKPKTNLKEKDNLSVDGNRPKWDSNYKELIYQKDQTTSFNVEDAINTKDFYDPNLIEKIKNTFTKFELGNSLSTNPDKLGNGYVIPLNLFAKGLFKQKKQEPTTAFELIEKLNESLETLLKMRGIPVKTELCCPNPIPEIKYSAFPIEIINNGKLSSTNEEMNFCYLEVKNRGYEIQRCIYINEFKIFNDYFYFLDVEPKYRNKKMQRAVQSFAVIFHTRKEKITIKQLNDVLYNVVKFQKSNKPNWEFLKTLYSYHFVRIRHNKLQSMIDNIVKFIESKGVYKPIH